MTPENWQIRTDAALAWAKRGIAATGGRGSAHSFSPIFGWEKAYPETTGYLIETLLDYAVLKNRPDLRADALACADWLCEIQLPSGGFPGGTVGGPMRPSVFNTGQILFGLARALEFWAEKSPGVFPGPIPNTRDRCQQALERAVGWLLEILENDGSWRQANYAPGFAPAYHSRVVWAVLRALPHTPVFSEGREAMQRALDFHRAFFLENGALRDGGFAPGQAAFTHTLAYAMEGFLESALLLDEPEILAKTIASARALLSVRQKNGRTAGAYSEDWTGDFSFLCLTGNAQLSIVFQRLFEVTKGLDFKNASAAFLAEMIDFQKLKGGLNLRGAIPGSAPFWGKYMRFRYPNWAAKFFLDALKIHCPENPGVF